MAKLYVELRSSLRRAAFPESNSGARKYRFGQYIGTAGFDSTGKLPNQNKEFQPRVGFAWDVRGNGKSALRASYGIFNARQNMLTQVGAITTNGVQQQSIAAATCLFRDNTGTCHRTQLDLPLQRPLIRG